MTSSPVQIIWLPQTDHCLLNLAYSVATPMNLLPTPSHISRPVYGVCVRVGTCSQHNNTGCTCHISSCVCVWVMGVDVPAWLKSLRLHKYQHLFAELTYDDMLKMNDAFLKQKVRMVQ